jgi:hypothetical protein
MKTRIFITVLVSSFLFLTSCNKEEVTDNPQNNTG